METGLTVGRKRMTPRTRKTGEGKGLYLSREKKGGVVANFSLRDAIPMVLAQEPQNTYF